jgi:hypothetical protein
VSSRRHARASAASPAASGASGSISGEVTSAATSSAIAGIEVCAVREVPFSESCVLTNPSGEYTVSGLEPDEYVVVFFAPEGSGLNFITQFYEDEATFYEANPVSVTAGATRTGIDAQLVKGGEISGTVTSAASKKPLDDVDVCAFDEELGTGGCATTNQTGEYSILGLVSGNYDVEFFEPFEGDRNYATQYYKGKSTFAEAEAVSVVAGGPPKEGIDAALVAGGQITGTVTSSSGGASLEGIEVCAFSFSLGEIRCSITDMLGHYDITSLSTAEYFVEFISPTGEYLSQYYNGVSTLGEAESLSIEAGRVTEHIDAVLLPAPPQELSPPTIVGSPVEGQTLKVLHAAWTGNPSSYRDEWYQCNDPEGEVCFLVGEGESYTVKATDVGHTIGVIDTAFNAAGKSEPALSELTAVVTAAPAQSNSGAAQSGSGSSGTPTPAAAIGVLSSTTSVASAAELKELLIGLLAPSGRSARIAALLKHDGYAVSFRAPSAGQLTISWYLIPKGAHLARAKPTLVAHGDVTLSAVGVAKLAIQLTGKGRAMLKHASHLKLTALGSITGVGVGPLSASKSFVLKR